MSLSHPEVRTLVTEGLAKLVHENFSSATALVGVATAGIAPGAIAAHLLGLPFAYIRPEPKKHGMGKRVEGDLAKGSRVVVVEDLVSTGKSSLAAVHALREEGYEIAGLAAVFSYAFEQAENAFEQAGCPMATLCNYHVLVQEAARLGFVESAELATLNAWRVKPEVWMQ